MINEALSKFAEELKKARDLKKITLQQIANKTKIDIKFLQAIEESKFDVMPDLYIRAFIKEYVQIVDLDPTETIKKFDLSRLGETEDTSAKEKSENQAEPVKKESTPIEQKLEDELPQQAEKKPGKQYQKYYLSFAASFVFLIIIYFLFIKESVPEIFIDQENIASEMEQPAYELDTANTIDNNLIPVNDSLQLTVNTLKRVWLKVLSDNNLRSEGMVDAGSKLNYRADKDFRVVVGNAGSVKMAFNGRPISTDIVGKQGEIRNLAISADTVKAFTIIVPAKNENQPPKTN